MKQNKLNEMDIVSVNSPDPDEVLINHIKKLSEMLKIQIPVSRPRGVCLSHRAWSKDSVT